MERICIKVLALDPGKTTGWFLTAGYEPLGWGAERDVRRIMLATGPVDVVVYEDALDLDRMAPLRDRLLVPWTGVKPEQLQRFLFSRLLGRHRTQGPLARREVVQRAFHINLGDPHVLDAACVALWYLAGSGVDPSGLGLPDLGTLRVWDIFTILTEFGEETYQVVPPNTADPAHGLVSWASPLVQALKDASPGQEVQVAAPAGDWTCTLLRIEPRL